MRRDLGPRNNWNPFDWFTDNAPAVNHIHESMRTDVHETESQYELVSELPGMTKEDVTLRYRDDILTISAQKHSFEDYEHGDMIHTERSTQQMARSFQIPRIDEDKITATLKDGILTVSLPKDDQEPELDHGKKIEIEIE